MNILLTGGTGFIGGELTRRLVAGGHRIWILTRSNAHFDSDNINYINSLYDIPAADYFQCFINLAGENMAAGRWSESRKTELLDSRVGTTRQLFELASRLDRPPQVLLSASAIGYYGHQGDERLAETAPTVEGFAQRLCQVWEDEAERFETLGTRVCRLRLGVVLESGGGPFLELTRSARLGVGSWLGHGRQWLSWVHREDVIAAMLFLLENETCTGPYNLTAPEPVTNREFCEELAVHKRVLVKLPLPASVARLALGEMAEELLLNGQRVVPRRLQEAGFEFRYNTLGEALPDLLSS